MADELCAGFRTAAQDRDIAGFERERASIRRHIRAAFIDDADDADGGCHTRNIEPVGARPAGEFAAHGIGQRGHIFDALGHRFDAFFIECKAIEHTGGDAICFCLGEICCVGGENGFGIGAQRIGGGA